MAPIRKGKFVRSGASTIAREQGKRLIAIKFSVRNRDLADAVAEGSKRRATASKSRTRPCGAASSKR